MCIFLVTLFDKDKHSFAETERELDGTLSTRMGGKRYLEIVRVERRQVVAYFSSWDVS
jgi:hypothetical protein